MTTPLDRIATVFNSFTVFFSGYKRNPLIRIISMECVYVEKRKGRVRRGGTSMLARRSRVGAARGGGVLALSCVRTV